MKPVLNFILLWTILFLPSALVSAQTGPNIQSTTITYGIAKGRPIQLVYDTTSNQFIAAPEGFMGKAMESAIVEARKYICSLKTMPSSLTVSVAIASATWEIRKFCSQNP